MAIAISPSGIFDIRFFLPRAVSFPLPQPSTDNRADHPRWYVGHRDCLRLRCGVAETQLRLSAAMLVHPMIRALRHWECATYRLRALQVRKVTWHLPLEPRSAQA